MRPGRLRRTFRLASLVAILLGTAPRTGRGQALPFNTATGITAGFQENAARTFVSVLGRSDLSRDGTSAADPLARDIDVVAVGLGVIPFAFTPLWTTRVSIPYVVEKSMAFDTPAGRARFETSGPGDLLVDTKWIFYSDNRLRASTRIGLQAGLKIPSGSTDARLPDGETAPRPLQVGTGSWDVPIELLFTDIEGRWGFHANAGWRFNTADDGFEAGDVFSYDAAIGFRFAPWVYENLSDQTLVAYLELNGEVARRDETGGLENPDSGGHVLFLSPDLQWVPTPWLLFEASVQFPVLQRLHGSQLRHEPRLRVGGRFRFSVFR